MGIQTKTRGDMVDRERLNLWPKRAWIAAIRNADTKLILKSNFLLRIQVAKTKQTVSFRYDLEGPTHRLWRPLQHT